MNFPHLGLVQIGSFCGSHYGKTLIACPSTPQETPFDLKEFQGSLGVHIDVNQGVRILQMLLHHAEGEERR